MQSQLRSIFCAKVILVNHEKRLNVDVACSNISINFNMLYLSVYQLIKQHITEGTSMGKALLASKKPKMLMNPPGIKDEFNEAEYSAAHFDLHLVAQLVKQTIQERRTNQKYILLEGLCNSGKLCSVEEQLELRFMDEFFMIEKEIGQIQAFIGLQFREEDV